MERKTIQFLFEWGRGTPRSIARVIVFSKVV